MIVDFHTHIFSPRVIESRDSFLDDANLALLYGSDKSRMADHEMLLRDMDIAGVDYAVAMGFPWQRDEYCRMQNDYLLEAAGKSGGRILPFASISVTNEADVADMVSRIRHGGFYGIGELAFYSEGVTEHTLGRLEAILDSAHSGGLPVCIHVNEPVGHEYAGKYDPQMLRLYSMISRHRDAVIILSHWGGGLIFYELMPKVKQVFENVYYDTAASPYLYEDRIYGLGAGIAGSRKILFGSDYPLIGFSRYIDAVKAQGLEEKDAENILGENALRILGLKTRRASE